MPYWVTSTILCTLWINECKARVAQSPHICAKSVTNLLMPFFDMKVSLPRVNKLKWLLAKLRKLSKWCKLMFRREKHECQRFNRKRLEHAPYSLFLLASVLVDALLSDPVTYQTLKGQPSVGHWVGLMCQTIVGSPDGYGKLDISVPAGGNNRSKVNGLFTHYSHDELQILSRN